MNKEVRIYYLSKISVGTRSNSVWLFLVF
jgi:hypothetical protein